MGVLIFLIPLALLIGLGWLGFFVWTLRSNQYDDLEGAARRILMDDDRPAADPAAPRKSD